MNCYTLISFLIIFILALGLVRTRSFPKGPRLFYNLYLVMLIVVFFMGSQLFFLSLLFMPIYLAPAFFVWEKPLHTKRWRFFALVSMAGTIIGMRWMYAYLFVSNSTFLPVVMFLVSPMFFMFPLSVASFAETVIRNRKIGMHGKLLK